MNLSPEVRAAIESATVTQNAGGFALALNGQLNRKVYMQVNKVLEEAGGTWNRKAKAHLFTNDPRSRLLGAVETGQIKISRDEEDYFPTPGWLAEELCRLANVGAGKTVLEPSAGTGAIAVVAQSLGGAVVCVEINADRAASLRNAGLPAVHCGDFLNGAGANLGIFDCVVMNPPSSGTAGPKHFLRAWSLVKPGGLLSAVLPSSVSYRTTGAWTAVREILEQHGAIIENLSDTFKFAGTSVSSVRCWARKPL